MAISDLIFFMLNLNFNLFVAENIKKDWTHKTNTIV